MPSSDLTPDQLDAVFGGAPSAKTTPDDYAALYEAAGKQHNIDPKLLRAVVKVESSGNPQAVSPAGAVGLTQLMPATAAGLGVSDPTDPKQAIFGAAQLLDENLKKYGNVQDALRAYHGGTDQTNWGPKTQAYPGQVATAYGSAQSAPPAAAPERPALASEGLTPGQLDAAFGGASAKPQAAPAPVSPAASPPDGYSAFNALPARLNPNANRQAEFEKTAKISQAVDQGMIQGAEDIPRGVVKTVNWIGSKAGGSSAPLPFEDDTQNRLAQFGGQDGFGRGRFLGNALVTAPIMGGVGKAVGTVAGAIGDAIPEIQPALNFLGGAAEGGKAIQYASKAANGAIQGAASTPLLAATSDKSVGDQIKQNALFGASLGAGLPMAADAAGAIKNRLVGSSVNPATAALVQKADALGVPIRGGQISNSPFVKTLDSVLETMPFSGQAAKNADQRMAFTKAVSNTIGEDTHSITPEVMQAAKTRIGGVMNDVAARTPIQAGNELGDHLGSIIDEATQVLSEGEVKPIQTQVSNILAKVGDDGVLPGTAYQALTRKGAPLDRAMSSSDPNVSHYAQQVRSALDDALERSAAPEDLAALQQARLQYKNMKTIEPLVLKGAPGEISPALLNGRVSANFSNRAYSGAGDLGDLADIGQRFIKEPPNSGTEQRSFVRKLLTNPLTAGAEMATGGYMTMEHPLAAAALVGGSALGMGAGRAASSFLGSNAYRNRLLGNAVDNDASQGLLRYLADRSSSGVVPASIIARNRLLGSSHAQ